MSTHVIVTQQQAPATVLEGVANMVTSTVLENMGGDESDSSDSGGEN